VRRSKIEELATKSSRAKAVLKALENQDTIISATQLGITLSSLALGFVAGSIFEPGIEEFMITYFPYLAHPEIFSIVIPISVGAIIAIGLTTYAHVVLGELVFKSVALQYPDATSMWVAKPLSLFTKIAYPLIWGFNWTAWVILKLFGVKQVSGFHNVHSEDELKLIINQSQKAGILDQHETEILSRAFDLPDTTVREIMTPRTELVMISINGTFREILEQVIESGHFPVYEGNQDKIIGFIYAKDILQYFKLALESKDQINFNPDLKVILREPDFVPETMKADKLLEMFQTSKRQVAVVVTEFGGVSGLISLEDVLELLVGDIQDEYDLEPPDVLKTENGDIINGQMSIDDFNEYYNTEFESEHSVTLGGFIIEKIGKIPEENETITLNQFSITVQKISDHRILELLVVIDENYSHEMNTENSSNGNGKYNNNDN
jgi:CBS domain containing-hemolysin-like protein